MKFLKVEYIFIKSKKNFQQILFFTNLLKGTGVLSLAVEAWKNQSAKRMKRNHFFILDGKLPLTME